MEMTEFDRQPAAPERHQHWAPGPVDDALPAGETAALRATTSPHEGDPTPDSTASGQDSPAGGQLKTRFGPVLHDPAREIRFRGGLPGFPRVERFQLEPVPGVSGDIMLLQSVEVAEIGFITMPLGDEVPVIRAEDIAEVARMLDIAEGELLVLAVVTLVSTAAGVEKLINLRAPLFVDVRRRIGAQVVLANAAYPLRHRILPQAA